MTTVVDDPRKEGKSVFRGGKRRTRGCDSDNEGEGATSVPKERLSSVRLLTDARSSDTATAATPCGRRSLALWRRAVLTAPGRYVRRVAPTLGGESGRQAGERREGPLFRSAGDAPAVTCL
ncbi:hypothetical protein MRX96_026965 [Rhipicephalus microplus]